VLHGDGITTDTRLLTSTLLGSAETLSNTLGSVSGLTDSNSISHSSGLGDRSVLLAVNLALLTNEVGKVELKTAHRALEAGLVIGLLDSVDRLKRISGLAADCALCSGHPDLNYSKSYTKKNKITSTTPYYKIHKILPYTNIFRHIYIIYIKHII